MLVGCVLATGMALIANRFILIPAYGIADAQGYFDSVWGYIIAFNLIKTVAISLITLLLYKRLSNTLKKLKF
jgi:riboflavin transporter FmnP